MLLCSPSQWILQWIDNTNALLNEKTWRGKTWRDIALVNQIKRFVCCIYIANTWEIAQTVCWVSCQYDCYNCYDGSDTWTFPNDSSLTFHLSGHSKFSLLKTWNVWNFDFSCWHEKGWSSKLGLICWRGTSEAPCLRCATNAGCRRADWQVNVENVFVYRNRESVRAFCNNVYFVHLAVCSLRLSHAALARSERIPWTEFHGGS